MIDSDTRDTLRVFYAPKDKKETEEARAIRLLEARVASLEAETCALTERLCEREQELLEALEMLEAVGAL
jgi:hypothetical protein